MGHMDGLKRKIRYFFICKPIPIVTKSDKPCQWCGETASTEKHWKTLKLFLHPYAISSFFQNNCGTKKGRMCTLVAVACQKKTSDVVRHRTRDAQPPCRVVGSLLGDFGYESREAHPGEWKLCFTFVPWVLSRERILACLSSSHIKAAKLRTSAAFVHITRADALAINSLRM